MGMVKEMAGKVFERWTVLGQAVTSKSGAAQWLCRCDCGNESIIPGWNLRKGLSRSCGCLNAEVARRSHTTHSMSHKQEYKIYHGMLKRCLNKNSSDFSNYGGRGINVCDRWLESFENFYEDMGGRPSSDYSLDRIENDGGYSPDNCKWSTRSEQQNNKRTNRILTLGNITDTLANWSRIVHISEATLWARIKAGWSDERALTQEVAR